MVEGKFWTARIASANSHERVKNQEADDDCLGKKEDGENLVIAFVARDRSRYQAGEINRAADNILRSQFKKVWDALEQGINEIDGRKQAEKDEKRAVV